MDIPKKLKRLASALLLCAGGSMPAYAAGDHAGLSKAELTAIVQSVVGHHALDPYLLATRGPLTIVLAPDAPEYLILSHAGGTVHYVERIDDAYDNYIEFTRIDADKNEARVEFVYPLEGVVGTVYLQKRGRRWIIDDFDVLEH